MCGFLLSTMEGELHFSKPCPRCSCSVRPRLDLLRAKKIFPDQIKEHGPGFDYPLYFVCAALLEGFTCMEDIEEIVSRVANCKYIFESPWSAAFAETYSSTG
jgi:hypothetical protein